MVFAHNQLRFPLTSRRISFPLTSSISRRAVKLTTCKITLHCVTIYVIILYLSFLSSILESSKKTKKGYLTNLVVIYYNNGISMCTQPHRLFHDCVGVMSILDDSIEFVGSNHVNMWVWKEIAIGAAIVFGVSLG